MTSSLKRIFVIIFVALVLMAVAVYHLLPGTVFAVLRNLERGSAALKQHSLDMGTLHMEYLEGGQGDVLVLLHGFGGDKDNWTRVAKYLTPYFRVVIPDLPGFGESTKDPDIPYTVAAQVDRLPAFLSALHLDVFCLGGNSMGGYIAGHYAAKFPQSIQALWLLAPGGVFTAEPSEYQLLLKKGVNPLLVKSVQDYDHLMDFVFFKHPYIPATIIQHFTQRAVADQPLHSRIFKQLTGDIDPVSLERILYQSQIPTLVVWGDKDRVLHVSGAKILESRLLDAKIQIMKDVGHMPMLEKPEATATALRTFLEQRSI